MQEILAASNGSAHPLQGGFRGGKPREHAVTVTAAPGRCYASSHGGCRMMWDHAAAQELLDALFAKAVELDDWDRQRAQEDERRCAAPQ
jgi:hypothetical protein